MVRLHFRQALFAELPKDGVDLTWAGQLRLQFVASHLMHLCKDAVHSGDCRGPQLDLHLTGVCEFCFSIDQIGKLRAVGKNTAMTQNLRNSVICEHRELFLVGELR